MYKSLFTVLFLLLTIFLNAQTIDAGSDTIICLGQSTTLG
ncbi:MAG: regulatory protein YycI of two-component signal transduction system YycFG, partial [Bacteroidia bacterium]